MSNNANVKKRMIVKYGRKCFIEELGIRSKEEVQKELRLYGKGQRRIMDILTYHHIIERFNGGKATEENGAILRNINHQWFNRLNKKEQREINEMFQEYKRKFSKECKVEFVDDLQTVISVKCKEFIVNGRGIILTPEEQKELYEELREEMRLW